MEGTAVTTVLEKSNNSEQLRYSKPRVSLSPTIDIDPPTQPRAGLLTVTLY